MTSDILTVVGSAGASVVAGVGGVEGVRYWRNRRADRRRAEATADNEDASAVEKFQAIWGEEFARQDRKIEQAAKDMQAARASWEEKQVTFEREISHLRQTVEALRHQIQSHGLEPAA